MTWELTAPTRGQLARIHRIYGILVAFERLDERTVNVTLWDARTDRENLLVDFCEREGIACRLA
jgi:hypothetical protein